MLISFKKFLAISLFGVLFLFASNANAQLTAGSFGINASFGSDWDEAGLCYTLSDKTEVGISLSYDTKSYSYDTGTAPDAETTIGFGAYFAYYLSKGDVSPFVALSAGMMNYPEDASGHSPSHLEFELTFGAQTFITKGVAIFGELGVGYATHMHKQSTIEVTTNHIYLFTSAVGATFYF